MKIKHLSLVDSIIGTDNRPYHAVDIVFEDGSRVQVERPISISKIKAKIPKPKSYDNVIEGQTI